MKSSAGLAAVFAAIFAASMPNTSAEDAPESATASESARPLDPNDLESLRPHLGQDVVVQGVIVGTGESKSGHIRYLNFNRNWSRSVSLVIMLRDPATEGINPDDLPGFVGKTVRVKGALSEHEGNLQIRIFSLSQIEAVEVVQAP